MLREQPIKIAFLGYFIPFVVCFPQVPRFFRCYCHLLLLFSFPISRLWSWLWSSDNWSGFGCCVNLSRFEFDCSVSLSPCESLCACVWRVILFCRCFFINRPWRSLLRCFFRLGIWLSFMASAIDRRRRRRSSASTVSLIRVSRFFYFGRAVDLLYQLLTQVQIHLHSSNKFEVRSIIAIRERLAVSYYYLWLCLVEAFFYNIP